MATGVRSTYGTTRGFWGGRFIKSLQTCQIFVWFEAGASPRWHARIDEFLVGALGFSRNVSDECFYVRIQGGIIAIIALYVDDLLIACNNIGILIEIKDGLSREFEMKNMDQARMCLGFRISRNRSEQKLTMSQEKYALSVLSQFGMSDANGA
jgi:Reverse transcriptase (RNA-dependent DNA polymerase)